MACLLKAAVTGLSTVLLLWSSAANAQADAVAGAAATVEYCSQAPGADAAPRPPTVWQEQEKNGKYPGIWRFAGSDGIGSYPNGVVAKLRITKYDGRTVELDRSDPSGLTAKYHGTIEGNHVTGTADFQIAGKGYPDVDWFATFEPTNPLVAVQQAQEAASKGNWHDYLADLGDAEAAGSAEAYERMGHYYEVVSTTPDYVTALRCYLKAEALGNAAGTLAVGRFYQDGIGGLDDLRAAERMREAQRRYLAVAKTDNPLGIEALAMLEIMQRKEAAGSDHPQQWRTLSFQAADGRTRVRAIYASDRRDGIATTMLVSCTTTGVRPAQSIDMWFLTEGEDGKNPKVLTLEYRRQGAAESSKIRTDRDGIFSNRVLVARASILNMMRTRHAAALTADDELKARLGDFTQSEKLTAKLQTQYPPIYAEARHDYLTLFSPASLNIEYATSATERHDASFNFQYVSDIRETFLNDCQTYDPFKPIAP